MGWPNDNRKAAAFFSLLECDTIRYESHRFPWHLHPGYYSFSLVLDGYADLVLKDQVFQAKTGDLILIPANSPHQTVVEDFFTNIIIRVSTILTDPILGYSTQTLLIRQPYASSLFLEWYRQLREVESSQLDPAPVRSFVYAMAALKEEEGGHQGRPLGPVDQARLFMHQNYSESIQLRQLSEVSHMSASHFRRRFKQSFGISPIRYLQSLRVDRAKGLIKQNVSMTHVAYQTGFYDQSHFNKYFKWLTGMAPGQYQAIIQQDSK